VAGLQALLKDVLEQCRSLKEEQQQQAKLLLQLQPQAGGAWIVTSWQLHVDKCRCWYSCTHPQGMQSNDMEC
jgi:hypothetical protein